VAAIGGGCLPPDDPVKKPAAPDELIHTWTVGAHVMARTASLTEVEAESFRGRTIAISASGYVSPWQGTCDEAGRTKRTRPLGDVVADEELSSNATGLPAQVTEYRLTCNDRHNPLPLVMYVAGGRAVSCFNGVCYLMTAN